MRLPSIMMQLSPRVNFGFFCFFLGGVVGLDLKTANKESLTVVLFFFDGLDFLIDFVRVMVILICVCGLEFEL